MSTAAERSGQPAPCGEAVIPGLGAWLWGRLLSPGNLGQALKRVEANRGAPGVDGMTTGELRSWLCEHWVAVRAAALVAALPQAGGLLPGALVEQHRSCGKEGCRCTRGEPHGPQVYLQVAGRLVYVPAGLADAVRAHVETSRRSPRRTWPRGTP